MVRPMSSEGQDEDDEAVAAMAGGSRVSRRQLVMVALVGVLAAAMVLGAAQCRENRDPPEAPASTPPRP